MCWDGINRRRYTRVKFPYTLHIFPKAANSISTYTEDISCQGVRAVIKNRLEVNEEVSLKIFINDAIVGCNGKVAWVQEKHNPMLEDICFFNTGIELHDVNTQDRELIEGVVKTLHEKKAREEASW